MVPFSAIGFSRMRRASEQPCVQLQPTIAPLMLQSFIGAGSGATALRIATSASCSSAAKAGCLRPAMSSFGLRASTAGVSSLSAFHQPAAATSWER